MRRALAGGLLLAATLLAGCASSVDQVSSGLWHHQAGLWAQAGPRLVDGVPALERQNPADPRLPTAYLALGDMAAAAGRHDVADDNYGRALRAARAYHAGNPTLLRNALVHRGNFLRERGRAAEAIALLSEAEAISARETSVPKVLNAIDLDNLSVAYQAVPDFPQAERLSRRALAVLDTIEQTPAVGSTRGVVLYNAAYGLAEVGRNAEAEALYRQALPLVSKGPDRWRVEVVRKQYAQLLRKMGREAEAKTMAGPVRD